MGRASDSEIMEYARAEARVVVTADLDYPCILAMTRRAGPGLVLFRGGSFSELEMLNMMKRVLSAVPEASLPTSLVVVDRNRIRRRDLPV